MTLLLLDLSLCVGTAAAFFVTLRVYREQLRASRRPVRVRSREPRA